MQPIVTVSSSRCPYNQASAQIMKRSEMPAAFAGPLLCIDEEHDSLPKRCDAKMIFRA